MQFLRLFFSPLPIFTSNHFSFFFLSNGLNNAAGFKKWVDRLLCFKNEHYAVLYQGRQLQVKLILFYNPHLL